MKLHLTKAQLLTLYGTFKSQHTLVILWVLYSLPREMQFVKIPKLSWIQVKFAGFNTEGRLESL